MNIIWIEGAKGHNVFCFNNSYFACHSHSFRKILRCSIKAYVTKRISYMSAQDSKMSSKRRFKNHFFAVDIFMLFAFSNNSAYSSGGKKTTYTNTSGTNPFGKCTLRV